MARIRSYLAEFKLIWKMIGPFWKSDQKYKAWAMLIIVVAANSLIVYGLVEINKWQNKFYNTLQDKNEAEFLYQILRFIPIVMGVVVVYNLNDYFAAILRFNWRQWMTNNLAEKWLYNNNFYRVMQLSHHPDNPDQRISEDLNLFTATALGLFVSFFQQTLSAISFSTILWNLSKNLDINILGLSLNIPGFLFWAVLIYCIIGTIITVVIGKPLVPLDFTQEKYEANFRYSLIRIREKREEIALYRGTSNEAQTLWSCFTNIRENFIKIVIRTVYLDTWRNFYINASTIFPFLISVPLYFKGVLTLGTVMQIGSAFGSTERSLSAIVTDFKNITAWLATSRRLLQLEQHLENARNAHKHSKIVITHTNKNQLAIEDLSLQKPDGEGLINHFSLNLNMGEKIMISGSSGIGKSTLVRSIAGLWPYGDGGINAPYDELYFVPQKPYLPIDSLRNIITYPSCNVDNSAIEKLLPLFNLAHLLPSLDVSQDWSMALSLGEQQRIGFIRILLCRPKWIIMDEPTSSLDDLSSNICFDMLRDHLPEAGVITVSHSENLKAYHDKIIDLGSYATTNAEK